MAKQTKITQKRPQEVEPQWAIFMVIIDVRTEGK
jgi:hypothetical protein